MTKKTEKSIEISFEEKLQNQINYLELESNKVLSNYHELKGALSITKSLLEEYLNNQK